MTWWQRWSLMCVGCAALLGLGGCQSFGMIWLDAANQIARLGNFTEYDDLAYGPDGRHRVDVYVPNHLPPQCPVVVFFHGGNWTEGYPDKSIDRFVGDAFTARGMIVVIANYRRYPYARSPAFVEDGARAVVWTHQHIALFGGDPDRLFVVGHSAGAQIAAMVACHGTYLRAAGGDPRWVKGLVGMAGPYWFPPDLQLPWLVPIFGPVEDYPLAQPINYVDAGSPPMLLLNGGLDYTVPLECAVRMQQRVQQVGGRVQTKVYWELGHLMLLGSLAAPVRYTEPVIDDISTWVHARCVELSAAQQ